MHEMKAIWMASCPLLDFEVLAHFLGWWESWSWERLVNSDFPPLSNLPIEDSEYYYFLITCFPSMTHWCLLHRFQRRYSLKLLSRDIKHSPIIPEAHNSMSTKSSRRCFDFEPKKIFHSSNLGDEELGKESLPLYSIVASISQSHI
jgi:hypothetical protein